MNRLEKIWTWLRTKLGYAESQESVAPPAPPAVPPSSMSQPPQRSSRGDLFFTHRTLEDPEDRKREEKRNQELLTQSLSLGATEHLDSLTAPPAQDASPTFVDLSELEFDTPLQEDLLDSLRPVAPGESDSASEPFTTPSEMPTIAITSSDSADDPHTGQSDVALSGGPTGQSSPQAAGVGQPPFLIHTAPIDLGPSLYHEGGSDDSERIELRYGSIDYPYRSDPPDQRVPTPDSTVSPTSQVGSFESSPSGAAPSTVESAELNIEPVAALSLPERLVEQGSGGTADSGLESTAADPLGFVVPSLPTEVPVTTGDEPGNTVEVPGVVPISDAPTITPVDTTASVRSISLGLDSDDLTNATADAEAAGLFEPSPAAGGPTRGWQRYRLPGALVVMLALIAIIAIVIATGSGGSKTTKATGSSSPSATPSPTGASAPTQGGATPSGGSGFVTIPTNSLSFGTVGATGNICQQGGTLHLTITIDGISSSTPVQVDLTGAGVPPSLFFQASSGVAFVETFPIAGGGTWSDRITSIAGNPPPSAGAQASGTWQC